MRNEIKKLEKTDKTGLFGKGKLDSFDRNDWNALQDSFRILHAGNKDKSELTEKQKLVAYAVSMGWNYAKIGRMAGLQARTISRWNKQPEFQKFLKACNHISGVEKVIEFFQERAVLMAKVVDEIALGDGKTETKLAAAKAALSYSVGNADAPTVNISLRDVYDKIAEATPSAQVADDDDTIH